MTGSELVRIQIDADCSPRRRVAQAARHGHRERLADDRGRHDLVRRQRRERARRLRRPHRRARGRGAARRDDARGADDRRPPPRRRDVRRPRRGLQPRQGDASRDRRRAGKVAAGVELGRRAARLAEPRLRRLRDRRRGQVVAPDLRRAGAGRRARVEDERPDRRRLDPGRCMCTTRKLWTDDGGKTWRATTAVGDDFMGSAGLLYWWQRGALHALASAPPAGRPRARPRLSRSPTARSSAPPRSRTGSSRSSRAACTARAGTPPRAWSSCTGDRLDRRAPGVKGRPLATAIDGELAEAHGDRHRLRARPGAHGHVDVGRRRASWASS